MIITDRFLENTSVIASGIASVAGGILSPALKDRLDGIHMIKANLSQPSVQLNSGWAIASDSVDCVLKDLDGSNVHVIKEFDKPENVVNIGWGDPSARTFRSTKTLNQIHRLRGVEMSSL